MKRTLVIGGGVAGLAASAVLANGDTAREVVLLEKNADLGGRTRQFTADGFVFDMGPSWYWMPDIFERFYNLFGHTTSDFYKLVRLDPSYQIFFQDNDVVKLPANYDEFETLFESYEKGSAEKLRGFLDSAAYKYRVGINEFVHKPSLSILEFADWRLAREAFRLKLFSSISSEIRSLFKNPKLVEILEFPVLFLGAKPENTPALYSLMNYADIKLGTWYPLGGMNQIARALIQIASEQGVDLRTEQEVLKARVKDRRITGLETAQGVLEASEVLASADYHHVETSILEPAHRSYSKGYWGSRSMAPSALVIYLGLKKQLDGLLHHNLFFDADFTNHASEIYDTLEWPKDPLFYVCCPSKTEPGVAPAGCENLFVLVPLAPGLKDSDSRREALFALVLDRLESRLGTNVRDQIIYRRTYCLNDFVADYHSYKGNAYGLSNTLRQTAFLKPRLKSKKINNLYFAGQLTTPGPGLPPSLISGEVAAKLLIKESV